MQKILSLLLLGCGLLLAQPPSGIAIRNARIVTGSGPILQKGTVVLRNGLIDAVGENVTIPADAWIINGEGMTVYPGLIDALSTVGISDPAAAASPAGATRGAAGVRHMGRRASAGSGEGHAASRRRICASKASAAR